MQLYPRHYKLIEFLEAEPKKKYDVSTLARHLGLSMPVIRNEIPKLCNAGYVKREPYGRTYLYFAARQTYKPSSVVKAEPLTKADLQTMLYVMANSTYEPKLNKLGWSLPRALFELLALAQGDSSAASQESCRKALTALHEAAQAYTDTLSRVLSTAQLWDDRFSTWLTGELSEENLEKLAELTRRGLTAHGRLASEQDTKTNKENTE